MAVNPSPLTSFRSSLPDQLENPLACGAEGRDGNPMRRAPSLSPAQAFSSLCAYAADLASSADCLTPHERGRRDERTHRCSSSWAGPAQLPPTKTERAGPAPPTVEIHSTTNFFITETNGTLQRRERQSRSTPRLKAKTQTGRLGCVSATWAIGTVSPYHLFVERLSEYRAPTLPRPAPPASWSQFDHSLVGG